MSTKDGRAEMAPRARTERPFIERIAQGMSVFLAGAIILFIEIAGSRLLAVIFGSSLYVWSSLITVTLLSIAFGAWWGGSIADRYPSHNTLSLLFLAAAVTLGFAVPLRHFALPLADRLDLRVGVFVSACVLFFLPLGFLAAVSPTAIRLRNPASKHLGHTVGWISALGTAGSCFGALATGFVLVPSFPLDRLFFYLSLALAAHAVALWKGSKKGFTGLFAAAWALALAAFASGSGFASAAQGSEELESLQNLYGQTRVSEVQGRRLLFLDGVLQGGKVDSSGLSIANYTAAMEVLGLAAVPDAKRALVIGLGAGILPSSLMKKGLAPEAVEINPQVTTICQRWFDLQLPTEKVHTEDGRRFLRKSTSAFDIIFVDAVSGEELPVHLITREAFEEMKEHLTDRGAVVLNYVGKFDAHGSKPLATLLATLSAVFPAADAFSLAIVGPLSNIILVGRRSSGPWTPQPTVPWGNGMTADLADILDRRVNPAVPYSFIFTDDYAPLDWLDREVRFTWRRESVRAMLRSVQGFEEVRNSAR